MWTRLHGPFTGIFNALIPSGVMSTSGGKPTFVCFTLHLYQITLAALFELQKQASSEYRSLLLMLML